MVDRLLTENRLAGAGFHQVFHEIAKRKDLVLGAKLMHALLISYVRIYKGEFPGYDKMVEDLAISRISAIRYVKDLEKAGLLRVDRPKGGKTNTYTLLDWTKQSTKELRIKKRLSADRKLPSTGQIATHTFRQRKEPKRKVGTTSNDSLAVTSDGAYTQKRGQPAQPGRCLGCGGPHALEACPKYGHLDRRNDGQQS